MVEDCVGELLYEDEVVYPGGCEEFMVYGAEVSGVFRLGEHFRVAWGDPGEFDVYVIYPAWREALRAVTGF